MKPYRSIEFIEPEMTVSEIERRAREMRAETIRSLSVSFQRWIAARFSGARATKAQHG